MSIRTSTGWLAAWVALTLPISALAYVGPGAGLSLLGALWGLLIALGSALLFVVLWPLRRLFKGRGSKTQDPPQTTPGSEADFDPHPPDAQSQDSRPNDKP